jgi:hypothetical protein
MSGGAINGNTASKGGGVDLVNGGIFTMSGGTISGNTTNGGYYEGGGGICVEGTSSTKFYLSGSASITGNYNTVSGGLGKNLYKDASTIAKYGTPVSPGVDIFTGAGTRYTSNSLTGTGGQISTNN